MHFAQIGVMPVAMARSHLRLSLRCAALYPLAAALPRCRSYAWEWSLQNRVPCLTSCGQLCQAHLRRLMWPCRLPWATGTTGVAAMVDVLRCDGSKVGKTKWSNHFWLNHSTDIRQYSLLPVTVK